MAIYTQDINLYSRDAMARLIRSQQTQLDMVQGKISAIISESELADLESGSTTMYNALANVQLDVSGVKADFSQLSSEYDSLTGEMMHMDSRIAEYKAGVDGLSAVISQTRAEVRGIGATNLLPMTRAFTPIAAGNAELTDETYTDCAVRRLQASGPGWTSACEYTLSDRALAGISTEKAAFTVSFWAMGSGTVDVQVIDDTGPGRFTVRDYQPSAILSGDWQRYSATVYCDALPDATSNVSLRIGTTGAADLRICAPKLERGAIATDWSPAPEDGETAIEDVETRTVTLEADVNGIKTDVTKISSGAVEGTFMEQTATNLRLYAKSAALVNDNLLFDTGAVYDKPLRSNGSLGNISGLNYVTSDFIPAKAETQYTFQVWTSAVVPKIYAKIVFYDSTKTAIGALPSANTTMFVNYNTDHAVRNFTSPANTAYIRITHGNTGTERGWAKLEEGETATRYSVAPVEGLKVNSETEKLNEAYAGLVITTGELEDEIPSIRTTVSQKVDKVTLISEINQQADSIKISASSIEFEGFITAGSGEFTIDEEGGVASNSYIAGDRLWATVFSTYGSNSRQGVTITDARMDMNSGARTYYRCEVQSWGGTIDDPADTTWAGPSFIDAYPLILYDPGVLRSSYENLTTYDREAMALDLQAQYAIAMRINYTEWLTMIASSIGNATSDTDNYFVDDKGKRRYPGINMHATTTFHGSMRVTGTKPRLVEDTAYGSRLLYAYETPTPCFGDVGFGKTDANGECYVMLDDIFLETVEADMEYAVFLQKEGTGDIWVEQKERSYFIVKGTPDLAFSWELKAVQKGFRNLRLDEPDLVDPMDETVQDGPILSLDEALREYDKEITGGYR